MEKRAWQILLVAELDDFAANIRDQIGQGAVAGREINWHLLSWCELEVQALHFDALIFIEPAGRRPGLSWLRAQSPESLPSLLYLLPEPDAASEAIAGQAGAFVLTLSDLLNAAPVLRCALAQTLRLGQAYHERNEQQRILQSVHDALIVVDTVGQITRWTGAAEKMYGWSADEAIGQMAADLLDSPLSTEVVAQLVDEMQQQSSFSMQLAQSNKTGAPVYVEVTGIPLYRPDGSLSEIVVANRDITARKAAQEALQKSHQELEAVLSSIAEAQISFDRDWHIVAVNQAATEAFFDARPVEELMGRVIWEIYPETEAGRISQKFHEAVGSGEAIRFEARADNVGRWYELHAFPHSSRLDVFMRDITERKLAEIERERLMTTLGHERVRLVYLVEGLRTSEELYRATFDNASVGMSHVSPTGVWLKVNDRLCEITGYSREELLKTTFQDLTHPDDLSLDLDYMKRMLRGEIAGYQMEKRYFHKDGHIIWIHLSAAVQRDEYDHPAYVISVIQDITDRKRLEAHDHFLIELGEQLARAETQDQIIALAVAGIGKHLQVERCMVIEIDRLHDQYHVFPDFHPDLPAMQGDYRLSKHPEGILAELDLRKQVVVEDRAVDEHGRSFFDQLICPAGSRSYVHTPFVRDEQWMGTLTVLSCTPRHWEALDLSLLRSVTDLLWVNLEKARLLENLRKSEERLRLALSSSGVTVFGQDDDLRSTWVYNPDAVVDAAALLGLSEGHLLSPEHAAYLENLKREVLTSGQQGRQEVSFDIDGRTYYYQLVIEPARDASGEINGILASALDVTNRRQSEEAITQYAHRLERSNRDLEDFAFIASHDLQEPLRKVRAFGRLLEDVFRAQFDTTAFSYLQRILSATERMQNMIDDLLAYSRVTTKGQMFAPVDLGVIASEVMTDLEVRIQQTGGQVALGELPKIDADRMQMQQLLQNLIGNALKFHQPDTPPQVRVSAQQTSARMIELVVDDNGIGFSEQFLERIFQPFQRLNGRSEFEGSGIGLAICRKIAERHGGSITAHSQVGQGSQFIVTLPIHHQEDD